MKTDIIIIGGGIVGLSTAYQLLQLNPDLTVTILEKENAVADFRTLIGATDPQKADAGTIRNLYAKSIDANAIHGSDSDENADIEGNFFFSGLERF